MSFWNREQMLGLVFLFLELKQILLISVTTESSGGSNSSDVSISLRSIYIPEGIESKTIAYSFGGTGISNYLKIQNMIINDCWC